jgi:hypothetical protein
MEITPNRWASGTSSAPIARHVRAALSYLVLIPAIISAMARHRALFGRELTPDVADDLRNVYILYIGAGAVVRRYHQRLRSRLIWHGIRAGEGLLGEPQRRAGGHDRAAPNRICR